MQSFTAVDHDKSNQTHRPSLSINTSFLKKKGWQHIFHSNRNHSNSQSTPQSSKIKRNSLPTPPMPLTPQSPKLRQHYTSVSLTSITRSPTNISSSSSVEHMSSDSNSTHTIPSAFKKLHLPSFHKKNSSHHPPSSTTYEPYTPTAPEHIMPALVDWSPEAPVSPPPWELSDHKRYSLGHSYTSPSLPYNEFRNDDQCHSDSEVDNDSKIITDSPTTSISDVSDMTLVTLTSIPTRSSADDAAVRVRRRSSCPAYDTLSMSSTSSSKTLIENDIISITEQHTRNMPVLKKYIHPVDKKPTFKPCQKAMARAAEAAANGEVVHTNSLYSTFCEDHLKYLYIPNVFDPETREPVLEFSAIKPRKYQLHRKTSWKREAKALMTWHHALEESLRNPTSIPYAMKEMLPERLERNQLTRRFILREFFTTEVNFWNQLYYTKIIFYDALVYSLSREQTFAKEEHADVFANLFDLMQFSAKLINRLRHFQFGYVKKVAPSESNSDVDGTQIECNNLRLGSILLDMSEDLVVFLRCAIDYKSNRKHLDETEQNEGFIKYRQRLQTRKETSYFSMKDYLIIPIQRVARYGLLLADLLKHTQPDHPDYKNLVRAYQIVTSLASAMDSVQKKKKN